MLAKKISLFVFSLLLPVAALAADQVGDRTTFSLSGMKEGKPVTGKITFEIVGYQIEDNTFQIRLTERLDGQAEEITEKSGEDAFSSTEQVNEIIENCLGYEGKEEEVEVPAGKFPVCTVPLKGDDGSTLGHISFGKVPFGLVQSSMNTREGTLKMELLEFHKK